MARMVSRMSGTWSRKSSGRASRVPLYSAYSSVRKVWRPTSNAMATWVGSSSASSLTSMERKPWIAFVARPERVVKFSTGSA